MKTFAPILKTIAVAAVLIMSALLGFNWAYYKYELDMGLCPSDSLGPASVYLEQFRKKNGRYPGSADEFYAYVGEETGGHPQQAMHRFKTPFVLMPPGLSDPEGGAVLLMCPPGSHSAFPRRYAFGVSEKGMVRISTENKVEEYRRKAK